MGSHSRASRLDTSRYTPARRAGRRTSGLACALLLPLVWVLAGCSARESLARLIPARPLPTPVALAPAPPTATAKIPEVDLALAEADVQVAPLPLQAGRPFTITATIHNRGTVPADGVPLLIYLAPAVERIGYQPFVRVLTVTVPATQTLPVHVPVGWNLAGGEHSLTVQVNRLPLRWTADTPVLPEANTADNAVWVGLAVEPFDAYISALCPGRVDVGIEVGGVQIEPDQQHVAVRVDNLGNQAVYNLPVVAAGHQVAGIAYTPAIPPCGGTATVSVPLDRALRPGELLTVQVNPKDWPEGMPEDDFGNNRVELAAFGPASAVAPATAATDYDFALHPNDIDASQPGIAVLTVHNLGTRDAAMVPVRIEGKAKHPVLDAVPIVRGGGVGVVAVTLDRAQVSGTEITIIVNPQGAEGAYPEARRDNNVVTITLP